MNSSSYSILKQQTTVPGLKIHCVHNILFKDINDSVEYDSARQLLQKTKSMQLNNKSQKTLDPKLNTAMNNLQKLISQSTPQLDLHSSKSQTLNQIQTKENNSATNPNSQYLKNTQIQQYSQCSSTSFSEQNDIVEISKAQISIEEESKKDDEQKIYLAPLSESKPIMKQISTLESIGSFARYKNTTKKSKRSHRLHKDPPNEGFQKIQNLDDLVDQKLFD
ncbi:Hypothetical_protein [Hexamita inflata]|uniref:Hypothetical_protein n=1 Tax=Hexamita inflata TaxID=28002 RepID=A0AA86P6D8_9EUKA|nr:Hypothetical protein HINF_LOCUS19373 [Hexamita inflata]